MASLLCHVLDRTLVWHRSIKTNKDTKLCLTSAANVCSEFPQNETLKVKLSLSNYGETKTERERRSESRRCESGTGRLSLCVMMQLFSVFTIVEYVVEVAWIYRHQLSHLRKAKNVQLFQWQNLFVVCTKPALWLAAVFVSSHTFLLARIHFHWPHFVRLNYFARNTHTHSLVNKSNWKVMRIKTFTVVLKIKSLSSLFAMKRQALLSTCTFFLHSRRHRWCDLF